MEQEKNKEERIKEIDERINALEEQRRMWAQAGGVGGRMAMQAVGEINKLNLEKQDLLYGTHKVEINKLTMSKKKLEALKRNAGFFKRRKYDRELIDVNNELERMLAEDEKTEEKESNNTK